MRPSLLVVSLALAACVVPPKDTPTDTDSVDVPVDTDVDGIETDVEPGDSEVGSDTDVDALAPTIAAVFPPDFVGVEATTTVYVEAHDDVGIASVTVGGVTATSDPRGFWVARDVPSDAPVVEVRDAAGNVASSTLGLAASPAAFHGVLRPLAPAADGSVIGYDGLRGALVRFTPDAPAHATIVSGAGVGAGPDLVPTGSTVAGIDARFGDLIVVGVATGNDVAYVLVDALTGERTVRHACTFPARPGGFVVGAEPGTFYVANASLSTVWACSAADPEPVVVTSSLPMATGRSVSAATWDAANHRLLFGENSLGEIDGVDPDDGTTSVVVPSQPGAYEAGVMALGWVGDDLFVASYGYGIFVHPASGAAQSVTGAGYAVPSGLAACTYDGGAAFCTTSAADPFVHVFTRTGDAWQHAEALVDSAVGVGSDVPWKPAWTLVAVQAPGLGWSALDLRYVDGSALVAIDGTTGLRTSVGTGFRSYLTPPLPSGTSATVGFRSAATFDVASPTPSPTAVAGDVTTLSGTQPVVALAPAGTRLVDDALVYVPTTDLRALRVRGLGSGTDEALATIGSTVAIAVGEDGAVYLAGSGAVSVVRPGASTVDVLAAQGASTLSYDARTRTVVAGYGASLSAIDADSGAVTPVTPTLPLGLVNGLRPGPFADTVIGLSSSLGALVLVDARTGATFVLAR